MDVRSPVDVETPSKRVEFRGGHLGIDPDTAIAGLGALAGFGNMLANSANAGGSITTAGAASGLAVK